MADSRFGAMRGRNVGLDRIYNPTTKTGSPGPLGAPPLPAGVFAPPPPKPTLQVFPWYLYEYPSAQDWYAVALNFAVPATGTTNVPGFTFTVNPQNVAVIKQLTMTVQNSLATIDLRVRLLINGAPVSGWNGIAFPPVAATGVIVPFNGMNIRLKETEILTAQFIEASATAWVCSLSASGWQVSVPEVLRVQGDVSY